jgi:hypothetical protein
MSSGWSSTCSACVFVSSQLGSPTCCPSHAGRWSAAERHQPAGLIDGAARHEPAGLDAPRPTAECPWPFTPHEYARLLLLRSRALEQHQPQPLEEASASGQVPTGFHAFRGRARSGCARTCP